MADDTDNVSPFSVIEGGQQQKPLEYFTYEFQILNPLEGAIQTEVYEGFLVVTDEWMGVVKANNQAQFAIPLVHVFKVKRIETKPADAKVN